MNARLYTALAVVLFASGCAGADPEELPSPADTGADVPAETSADTAIDSSSEDTAPDAPMDASLCGNGFVNTGEECDDGNSKDGDGCSTICKLEPTGPADVCDGETLTLTSASDTTWKGTISADTSTANANYVSKCGGGLAKDLVYKFVAPTSGKAVLTLEPEFAAVLSVRSTCDDGTTEYGCVDQTTPKIEPIKLTIDINKDQPYFVIVDGYGGGSGKFKLTVETLGEKCNNGRIEGDEQCEDGNSVGGDGCNASCRLENPELLSRCPGAALQFKTGGSKTILLADRFGPGASFEGTCFVTTSPLNNVYAITSEYAATMHLELRNERGGVLVYVRSECAGGPPVIGTPPDLGCTFDGITKGKAVLDVPVVPGRAYFVFVDSTIIFDKPDPGRYELDIKMLEPRCGNGILETGEEWDDGNNVSGDGVTADCKLETSWVSDMCSTTPSTMPALTVTAVGDGSYKGQHSGTTTGFTSGNFRTCPTGVSGPQAPDVVYRLRSPIDGLATVTANARAFSPLLSAFSSCVDNVASMIGCDNFGTQSISFPVTRDTDSFVVVDSFASGKSGPYTMNVVITPPVCGNGVKEGSETCDDGNTTSGDGCGSTCQLEPVTAHEKCADAELVTLGTPDTSGSYRATIASGITNLAADQSILPCKSDGRDAVFKVVAPIDGVITARVTAPFDASLGIREGACTDTGAPKRCSETGPTAIEEVRIPVAKDSTYYVVVDAATTKDTGPFTLTVTISPSKCGDGMIGGGEQCDDGNTSSGDGCSATCTLETLAGVDTCPGYSVPFVADGTRQVAIVTVDTSKLSADYAASCGGAARDATLAITPPIAGKALVEVLENDRVILHARGVCTDGATQLGCSTKRLEFPVAAGKPFSLFVDGPPGVEGPASVRVTVTP